MRTAPAALLAAAALAALAAGCMDDSSRGRAPGPETLVADDVVRFLPDTAFTYHVEDGPPPGTASDETYWLVAVTGHESRRSDRSVDCDRSFSFHLDPAARKLLFDPAWHPYDPAAVRTAVATDVTVFGACPLAYGLQANGVQEARRLGALGNAAVYVDPVTGEADIFLDDRFKLSLAPGQVLRLAGDGSGTDNGVRFEASTDIAFTHHGAWPRSALRAEESGLYW